ncbi:hypothetical protein A2V55_00050 [Candidatus Woesebacteria bacterium RBG_19FT_COMBO_37_29]|uniref:Bacterial Ig-like domain-containing protein n=1 Tax=Candidatus Woesebacteria bacterium RBG_19FT_COMBO_37_29 TaxID=1802486 RepID=A0A1F7XQM6_9BACT|nr:MAG: hypothetical protein A2V55_00050 [Candidatus Woesebacteria bacterium RBG_19FT_COMBO_37_29]
MRRFYSRLAHSEEKKNFRKAFLYILLTISSFALLVFFGLPSIAKMASFLTDLRKSSSPVEKNDTTPPAPPRFNTLPEATNKKSIGINGTAEEGATVKIYINDREESVLSDNNSQFNLSITLTKGENKISAVAKDLAGNESQKSDEKTIIFDEDPPKLEITSPENNKEFYGSKERQVVIQGISEEEISVTINERVVFVEDDGSFSFATSLSEGDNNFSIKAQDKAGNTTETSLTLKFSS